ncbi:hypothetical protein EKD04_016665 [Chloroflexales bacterium ZM16-3]|nr:hypothetical protein [Chloroflexales bacterium ZM16-3]
MSLENFFAAIESLGTTQVERAQALGITDRQLLTWRKGKLPRLIKHLVQNPDLLHALAEDSRVSINSSPSP